jgi:CheY-like chemotaxis protein
MRILVVDDYPANVESMALLLRLDGYEVEEALDGVEALRKAEVQQPDVVLLDISMPGMDGYQVARKLRSRFPDRPLWLFAVTAKGSAEDRKRCYEAGFDFHLVKPADPEQVQQLLRNLALALGPI